MTLDIAMGGSTNTVLHLLAAAQRAVDFHHGRHRPPVARAEHRAGRAERPHKYHMEDVHRAGGIPASSASSTAAD